MILNGWHRITFPLGKQMVLWVESGHTSEGTVSLLQGKGCLIEEVYVFTGQEMRQFLTGKREVFHYER